MTDLPDPAAPPMSGPLRLNDRAPDFTARTTMGQRSLSDYRGRWLLLFSHPADFTPVCTSEFVALARHAEAFAALQCDLLALSVDSLYAHLAWLKDIHDRFGVTVPFPIIEDPSMAIGQAYGMIDPTAPDSATVRATYVLDPQGVVRAIIWYPMNVGRSVEELLRLVTALQAAEQTGASAPEGWRPGASLLEPAAVTLDQALSHSSNAGSWYYRERKS